MNNADNGMIPFTNIYLNNIDIGFIQIGGKSIAISRCLPTFPRNKRNTKYNNTKHSCHIEYKLPAKCFLCGLIHSLFQRLVGHI